MVLRAARGARAAAASPLIPEVVYEPREPATSTKPRQYSIHRLDSEQSVERKKKTDRYKARTSYNNCEKNHKNSIYHPMRRIHPVCEV